MVILEVWDRILSKSHSREGGAPGTEQDRGAQGREHTSTQRPASAATCLGLQQEPEPSPGARRLRAQAGLTTIGKGPTAEVRIPQLGRSRPWGFG